MFKRLLQTKYILVVSDFKTVTKKFLDQGIERAVIDEYFIQFKEAKTKNKIKDNKEKDIDTWGKGKFEDFQKFVDKLGETKTKGEKKVSGAKKVAENENWVVYEILNRNACIEYGSHNWCISHSEVGSHYTNYSKHSIFFFILSKNRSKEDRWYKIAAQYKYDNGTFVYWDDRDVEHPHLPNDLGTPELDTEKLIHTREFIKNLELDYVDDLPKMFKTSSPVVKVELINKAIDANFQQPDFWIAVLKDENESIKNLAYQHAPTSFIVSLSRNVLETLRSVAKSKFKDVEGVLFDLSLKAVKENKYDDLVTILSSGARLNYLVPNQSYRKINVMVAKEKAEWLTKLFDSVLAEHHYASVWTLAVIEDQDFLKKVITNIIEHSIPSLPPPLRRDMVKVASENIKEDDFLQETIRKHPDYAESLMYGVKDSKVVKDYLLNLTDAKSTDLINNLPTEDILDTLDKMKDDNIKGWIIWDIKKPEALKEVLTKYPEEVENMASHFMEVNNVDTFLLAMTQEQLIKSLEIVTKTIDDKEEGYDGEGNLSFEYEEEFITNAYAKLSEENKVEALVNFKLEGYLRQQLVKYLSANAQVAYFNKSENKKHAVLLLHDPKACEVAMDYFIGEGDALRASSALRNVEEADKDRLLPRIAEKFPKINIDILRSSAGYTRGL